MRCPSCGHENPEGARLCRDCGLSLFVDCASCGNENPVDRTFCTNCGTQLRETSAEGMGVSGAPAVYEVSRPAGFWIRFAASIIDTLPLLLVSALLSWLLFGENLFDIFVVETDPSGEPTASGPIFTPGTGVNLILSAVYATAMVSMLGGTIGVLLLRMRVLRPDGTLLSPGRALARFAVLTISGYIVLPIIVSAFMVAFRADRRGIHDIICDTVVVIRE